MRTKKLIKHFVFEERNRSKITLGTGTRLNPIDNVVELISVDGKYPTDDDLHVKTWIANPNSVRQWLGFECVCVQEKDDLGEDITELGFRLSDGINEYRYNGAAWEVNTTDWNTESEISNNISTFTVDNKSIQVILNLYTTSDEATPKVSEIKILYSSDIKHHEDYIYRTFVRQLRQGLRPISDHIVKLNTDTNTVDLSSAEYAPDSSYNIVGIDAIFNHDDDSEHWSDLFSSFDVATKIITLTSTLSADTNVWIQFIYEPKITVNESSEYEEVATVPVVVITNIKFANQTIIPNGDSVVNKSDHTAVKILGPRRADIEMTLNIVTSSSRDQSRMADELRRYFDNHQIIKSWGLDEDFRLHFFEDFDKQNSSPMNSVHSGKLRCVLIGALFYEREAQNAFSVTRLRITGGNVNADIE
jgi:hypothetical protein